MRIVLACATLRGLRFLERLAELAPEAELTVFSFQEEPHEPPFLEPIAQRCQELGAEFRETRRLGARSSLQVLREPPFDLMLTVNWRYLIPSRAFQHARIGAFVLHDSLLPEYRGFSPTVWSLINGEDHTGVTLFQMTEGMDTGAVVDQRRIPLGPDDTIDEVLERVTLTYLELLDHNLPALLADRFDTRPQDESLATYCCKRLPEDNGIDWKRPSVEIHNLIRAVTHPYPGAFTFLNGQRLTVWASRRLEPQPVYLGRVPGRVAEVRIGEGVVVMTGDGALLLTRVQVQGGEETDATQILKRLSDTLGTEG